MWAAKFYKRFLYCFSFTFSLSHKIIHTVSYMALQFISYCRTIIFPSNLLTNAIDIILYFMIAHYFLSF